MRRHIALPIAAATAAGLLLAGCSSDGDSDDDGIAGADSSASATPDATDEPEPEETEPEPEPEDGIDRPDIELPEDVINVFEEVDTDDPVELAALADQEHHLNSVDEAITSGELDRPALPFYASGEALLARVELASGMHDDGLTISGTVRYYNRTITLRGEDAATTSYCIDVRESYTVDLETGERTVAGDRRYLGISRLELNEQGIWQTVMDDLNREEESC